MLVDTVRFSHILEEGKLHNVAYFLSHTAFVVSHKTESIETLLGVLWYLPGDSPVIVVTNCPEENLASIKSAIQDNLTGHKKIFMVHQKDERVAHLFGTHGVEHILGYDGKVLDGKGEGMYIGTLFAALLGYPQWIVFYDADNIVPCALLEYTLAMGRLFLAVHPAYENRMPAFLHNVRICWSSKPSLTGGKLEENVLGRCTRVISPLFHDILEHWFGVRNYLVSSSNAGEQGMTMTTAKALRFSSGFSVETFQLLDFLLKAAELKDLPGSSIYQQYQSKSPHFHTKREDEHIRKMIAVSLGSFFVFRHYIPAVVEDQICRLIDDLRLYVTCPLIYPSLDSLDLSGNEEFVHRYRIFDEVETGEYKIATAVSPSWSDGQ
jgi:mannosyl-3-phosphoglycerate synthase